MGGYWITWAVLLAFTTIMLWLDGASASMSRQVFVWFMLAAMTVKVLLIGGNFMHLRGERLALTLTVVVGLIGMGLVLYVLIIPDAARIHSMVNGQ